MLLEGCGGKGISVLKFFFYFKGSASYEINKPSLRGAYCGVRSICRRREFRKGNSTLNTKYEKKGRERYGKFDREAA